jgi:hypothetical protein
MEINAKMSTVELEKVGALLVKGGQLGMKLSGYGEIAVNPHSGNVYMWLEDYDFCLYDGPSDHDIMACWSSSEDGREEFMAVTDGVTLHALESWARANREQDEKLHA